MKFNPKFCYLLIFFGLLIPLVSATIITVTENPEFPMPTEDVQICAEITDIPSDVSVVTLGWDNGNGDYGLFLMFDPDEDGIYCRTIAALTVVAVNDMTVDYEITVEYDDDSSETVSGDFTYDNEAPYADADGPYICNEGEIIYLDGESTDNHPDGVASYLWSAPNGGIFTDPTLENPEFACYCGNGLYTISLQVTDFGGRTNTDTSTVTVNNVAPIADANGPYICTEGQSIVLDGSGSSDPGPGDALTYAWDLDNDGLFDDAFVVNPTYNCVEGLQIIPIALRVSDEEDSSTDTSQITIINSAPRVTNLQVVGGVINEGTPMTLRVTFTDFGPDTHDAVINWGDGSIDTVVDPANSPFERVHTYDDGDNAYTITVIVTDDDLASDTETLDVFVNNVAPTADADGPYNVELDVEFCGFEGSSYDPAGIYDTYTYYWNFDYDGNYDCDSDLDVDANDFVCTADVSGIELINPCWTYDDLGEYIVALMVCDEDYTTFGLQSGCSVIDTADLTVEEAVIVNNPPFVEGIPDQTIIEGEAFEVFDLDDYLTELDSDEIIWSYEGNLDLIVEIDENNVVTVTAPDENWNGAEIITFTATDNNEEALADIDSATFTITPINDAPVIEEIGTIEFVELVRGRYQVVATDPERDTLTYSLADAPLLMKINSETGLITWRPVLGKNNVENIKVIVGDGTNTTEITFDAVVKKALEIKNVKFNGIAVEDFVMANAGDTVEVEFTLTNNYNQNIDRLSARWQSQTAKINKAFITDYIIAPGEIKTYTLTKRIPRTLEDGDYQTRIKVGGNNPAGKRINNDYAFDLVVG